MLMTLEPNAGMRKQYAVMDTDTVRSSTNEPVLNEFGKPMLAHSNGYYDFAYRMEVLRTLVLRRMGDNKAQRCVHTDGEPALWPEY